MSARTPLPPERSSPAGVKESAAHVLAYRADIDGMRAVAVLGVIAFHAGVPGLAGGFTGVDIFFVLSGYLISGIIIRALDKGTFSFRDFYSRRINRIFPALIVILLGTLALGWYLLFPVELRNLGEHMAAGSAFLSNAALIRESGYFDTAAEKKPLLHLWSLAIEEQFYLLWPLFLFLCRRQRIGFLWPAAAIGTLSYLAAVLAANSAYAATAFFLPFTRLWELVAGYAVFEFGNRRDAGRSGTEANWQAWAGILLLIASFFTVSPKMQWPGPWTFLPVAGTALLLASGNSTWVSRRFLSHPAMVGIGLISYPLYLWHWPLLAFARFVEPVHTGMLLVSGAVVLSFVLAGLTYRLIEFPIRSRSRGKGRSAIALAVVLALTGMLGGFVAKGGLQPRLGGAEIKSIQDALIDWKYPGGGVDLAGRMRENVISGSRDTVLFAGDSHMEQYWPRMDSLVRSARGRLPTAVFITERACPTLPGVGRIQVPACAGLYDAILKRAAQPGIRAVVLTSYWDDFFRRKLLFEPDDPARKPIVVGTPAGDSIFAGFERDVGSLVRSGKKVFIVLTIPIGANGEYDPRTWLPGRLDASQRPHIIAGISRTDYERRTEAVLSRVRKAAEGAGAVVIDPVPYLCTGAICPTIDRNGRALYMDARHLRASVSRERAGWMDETLK